MNKRSAMLMAAGLVAALAVGVAAMTFSLGGNSASAEDAGTKPIVRTVRDTVTIHKKAKGSNDRPTVVTVQTSSGTSADDIGDAIEDAGDHDGDDDRFDEGHETEDHEDEHEEGHEEGDDD